MVAEWSAIPEQPTTITSRFVCHVRHNAGSDSDVFLSTVNASVLEVYYVAAVQRRKLTYA